MRGSIDRAESSKSEPIKSAYSPSVTSGKPLGYGIDFGTSNSAVSIAYADRVEILSIGATRSSRTLPSFVYLHRSGQRLAGSEAVRTFLISGHEKTDCWNCPLAPYGWDTDCRQYRKGGGCNDARLLSGVKHELAKLGFAGTNSWATDFSVAALVSVVLTRLKGEADSTVEAAPNRVVLGHSVVFAGSDPLNRAASDADAFKRLPDAASAAELVHALLYEGHAYDFYKAIESAKIALSDAEHVELKYPALDLRIPLRRISFESMIRPELDLVGKAIASALTEAGIEAKDVDHV